MVTNLQRSKIFEDANDKLLLAGSSHDTLQHSIVECCQTLDLEEDNVSLARATPAICQSQTQVATKSWVVGKKISNSFDLSNEALHDQNDVLGAIECDTSEIKNSACKAGELEDASLVIQDSSALELELATDIATDVKTKQSNQSEGLAARLASTRGCVNIKDSFFKLHGDGSNMLASASAMDLLKLAYADGTPVSTPEVVEAEDSEPDLVSPCSISHDCMESSKGDLSCSRLVDISAEDTVTDLLKSREKQSTFELQNSSSRVLVKADVSNLVFGPKHECMNEKEVSQVEDLPESSLGLYKHQDMSKGERNVKRLQGNVGAESLTILCDYQSKVEIAADFAAVDGKASSPHKDTQGLGEMSGTFMKMALDSMEHEYYGGDDLVPGTKDLVALVKEERETSLKEKKEPSLKEEKETSLEKHDTGNSKGVSTQLLGRKSLSSQPSESGNGFTPNSEEPSPVNTSEMNWVPNAVSLARMKGQRAHCLKGNEGLPARDVATKNKVKQGLVPKFSLKTGKSTPGTEEGLGEDNELLVDLMKLKGTDLASLCKRRNWQRSPTSAELQRQKINECLWSKQQKLSSITEGGRKENNGCKAINIKVGDTLDASAENLDHTAVFSNSALVETPQRTRVKELAVEVFSTRRSRLKLRKPETFHDLLDKRRKIKDGSCSAVKISEDMVLEGSEESSKLEKNGVTPINGNSRKEPFIQNRLLPDMFILLECFYMISGHRFAPLFKFRPEIQGDMKYRHLVKKHMDLDTVQTNLEQGKYTGSLEFFRDMLLIFSNALIFNSKESQEYGAALILHEIIMKEMYRYLNKESPQLSPATHAAKVTELRAHRGIMNCSVFTSNCKSQGDLKSPSNHESCDTDLDTEISLNELNRVTNICAKNVGPERTLSVEDLDQKEKDPGVKAPGKAILRCKMARTKLEEAEERLKYSKERCRREKHSWSSEDRNSKKKEVLVVSQDTPKVSQSSSRSSRASKRELSEHTRSSKYRSRRQALASIVSHEEHQESLSGGRPSRHAKHPNQAYLRENRPFGQPQKKART